MDVKTILSGLNALRGRILGVGIHVGIAEVVVYQSELDALDEAIELLKDIEK